MYGIFLLETVQTVLSGADLYYWFAAGFGNVDHLTSPFLTFLDVPIMGAVVSLSVQFFFVYRISVLSEKRSRWLRIIICLVNLSAKFLERRFTLPVGLHYRRISGICSGILCEPFHFAPQNKSQFQQSYVLDGFMEGIALEIFETVKPLNEMNYSITEWLCPTRPGSPQTPSLTCLLHPRCFIM